MNISYQNKPAKSSQISLHVNTCCCLSDASRWHSIWSNTPVCTDAAVQILPVHTEPACVHDVLFKLCINLSPCVAVRISSGTPVRWRTKTDRKTLLHQLCIAGVPAQRRGLLLLRLRSWGRSCRQISEWGEDGALKGRPRTTVSA